LLVERLEVQSFRNYERASVTLAEGLNVLLGGNAQGKTALLEAIYLLATTKSLRGARDLEMVRWSAERAVAKARVLREKRPDVDLEVDLAPAEGKIVRVNGVRQTRFTEYIGQLTAVSFSNEDVEVIRGEPAVRRRFLDLEICQISPAYCIALAGYKRVLEQRNRLLKTLREHGTRKASPESGLAAWNEQLIQHGARLMERRAQYLKHLEEFARETHNRLTGNTECLGYSYHPTFELPETLAYDDIRGAFHQALEEREGDELRRGMTLIGPHRDELVYLVNGHDVKVYGSQGQQRSVALSTKLAEVALIRELTGEPPVCLLDEVFAELDEERQSHVMAAAQGPAQTFLTATSLKVLPPELVSGATVHRVRAGELNRE
jgi:DNA replication and repair protein RecF